MKILYITHHWVNNTHHSNYSGYQRLVNYIAKDHQVEVVTIGNKEESVQVSDNIIVHYVKTPKRDFFFFKRLVLSYKAKKIAKKNKYNIIHVLYTDSGFFFNKYDPLVNTLHLAPGIKKTNSLLQKLYLWFRFYLIDSNVIRKSKQTIVISKNLKLHAKKYNQNVKYIPHGIDIEFWVPYDVNPLIKNKKYSKTILCVGSHGLDYGVFGKMVGLFPNYLFIFVGKHHPNLISNNLECKADISDDELKYLYSICDLFFRPVLFATANNSILEAMAMGKKIVTNPVGGINDYLNDEIAYLVYDEKYSDTINKAILDNNGKGIKSRQIAKKYYSWQSVAHQICKIYLNI